MIIIDVHSKIIQSSQIGETSPPNFCLLPGVRGGLNVRCFAAVTLAAKLIGRGDNVLP